MNDSQMNMDYGTLTNGSFSLNDTFANISKIFLNNSPEIECLLNAHNQTVHENKTDENRIYCEGNWDGASCWPSTAAEGLAVLPCFSEFNGISYDTSQNATRLCQTNGSWARTDYSNCTPLPIAETKIFQGLWGLKEATTIYYCGYSLSLVALIIALWIFLYFKDLRCVRNTIHINLMVTYVLFELTWIFNSILLLNESNMKPIEGSPSSWCFLFILLTYFLGTNFFWMLVEGLYLYILVVKTFSMELVNIHIYALIGWGLPMVIVLIWAPIAFYFFKPNLEVTCPWQNNIAYGYIYQAPFLIVLLINIFFLQKIMWVLVTKLRATTNVESKQYRKAAKALLVLIPLLGVTHMLFLVTPTSQIAKIIVTYVQAAFLSTQGFTVAVLYCFLNGEVRNSVRHHFQRWKQARSLRGKENSNSRNAYVSRSLRYSEGMKMYRTREDRDRGSCISFTTTTTYVSNVHIGGRDSGSGQRQLSNGSGYETINTHFSEEAL